jgi:outer membrane protein OmpA-like peptidoglycan-associated protein
MKPASLLAVAGLALVVTGCASAGATDVTLLDGENGASAGAVVVIDTKTARERGVLDTANTRANAGARRVKAKKVKTGFWGWLTGGLPDPATHFTLYFKEGTTDLTPESEPELQKLMAEIARRSGVEVQVTGHTDTLGADADNDALSLARAQEVRDMLVHRGLDLSTTRAVGRGERELLVATPDAVREDRNRRVEVTVR